MGQFMQRKLNIIDYGLADYNTILEKQLELKDQRQTDQITDTVLLVEHNPVITLGARKSANKLNIDIDKLKEQGIEVIKIRRGGGVTAHNPGQLVIYPIINIQKRKLSINEYVRTLEQIGIELLDKLGIKAERSKGFPGLWVNKKKIASIGVRVSKGVTYHGIAININNDLSIFDYMIPCGLDDVEMTSALKETGKKNTMDQVKDIAIKILNKHFK
jgi:lipoyl(octanoyl) transferase